MKKLLALMAILFMLSTSGFAGNTGKRAIIKPFDASYNFELTCKTNTNHLKDVPGTYLWFTDIDYSNPTGSYCDVWYEVDRLHDLFPGYQFTPYVYSGLNEFEYGMTYPNGTWTCVIYSDYWHGNGPGH